MEKMPEKKPITVALTGASGAQYGLRLIQWLVQNEYPIQLLISKAALMVLALEMDIVLGATIKSQKSSLVNWLSIKDESLLTLYGETEWTAPFASGSNVSEDMVICPCSMGTLAAISSGQSNNLIERAADVIIKERKNLILVVRETPFSTIHLKNMLTLSQLGVQIMPANPGFYHRPKSVDEVVDFMVARVLDQLNIPQDLMIKWGLKNKGI